MNLNAENGACGVYRVISGIIELPDQQPTRQKTDRQTYRQTQREAEQQQTNKQKVRLSD